MYSSRRHLRPKNNISVWRNSLFLLLSFFLFSAPVSAAEDLESQSIAPHRGVVLKGKQPKPSWVQLWEKARASARNSDDIQAAEYYRQLFAEKPQIEEALREYALVLMNLKQWPEAAGVVQQLLEFDEYSLEYLLYAGRIALIQQRYKRAAHYLGQVYTLSPDGSDSIEALRGQIKALLQLERVELAYPLMEQLYLRVPHEKQFIQALARNSLKLGYRDKAATYYRTLFAEFEGNDVDFLASEPLFVAAGDEEMSVFCWQEYLKHQPLYFPFHVKLSELYLEKEQPEKALPHLLVRIDNGDNHPHIYLATAKIYTFQEGRPDKALHYYDEYQKRNPSDTSVNAEIKRIQAVLADDLLAIVENEGAWPLWRDLAKVIPDRLAVYYSMAEKLASIGKDKELTEVLEIINHHNPEDSTVIFQLAHLYFDSGKLSNSTMMLDALPAELQRDKDYFFLRAGIEEKKGNPQGALGYYKSYLAENSKDYEVVLRCMQLAGDIGSIKELSFYYSLLPKEKEDRSVFFRGNLLYGELLAANYLTSTARDFYRHLLTLDSLSHDEGLHVQKKIVDTLQSEQEYFSAEQLLRELLITENGSYAIVTELIENSLLEEDWERAWKWYEFLVENSRDPSLQEREKEYLLLTWEAEILEKSGEVSAAAELVEDYLEGDNSGCSSGKPSCRELQARLAELYYKDGEFSRAGSLINTIFSQTGITPDLYILEELVQAEMSAAESASRVLRSRAKAPVSSTIERALFHKQYMRLESALQLTHEYIEQNPTSLQARALQGDLLMLTGNGPEALAVFRQLAADYPEELRFQQGILDLLFKVAEFEDLLVELVPDWKTAATGRNLLRSHSLPENIELLPARQKVLLARTLWALRRWNYALRLYESLMQVPVDHSFSEQLERAKISLVLPPPKRTFWHWITFTKPSEPDRLTVVMSPQFTWEHLHEPPVSIATGLYASYRWQQVISRELSVRRSMNDGNYYQAMKEYQNLLSENPSMESLYDLAGVYSRLGFSGKEASLYEIIQEESPGYPNLDEAIRRNSLKRQPRLSLDYHSVKKTGRENYFDNRGQVGGLQSWFMPSLKHEVTLDLQRIYNKSDEVEQTLWRNRLYGNFKWSPVYDLDFLAGVGGDRPDGNGTAFLYNLGANGRIGDMLQGYCRMSQDVIDDTVESLASGVKGKEYEAGFSIDFLPRLFGGYDYRFTEYSDGNHQNRYELWTSYILNSEPKLLQFRYGYEYSHNDNTNKGRDYSYPTGFVPGDHPYWSPKEYWQHLFTVSFEHQLAEDVLGRSAPSYYSLEYSFGYENGGYDNHQFKTQIFLEMSRHLLLNGTVDFVHGSEYKEQDFLLSLIYRW